MNDVIGATSMAVRYRRCERLCPGNNPSRFTAGSYFVVILRLSADESIAPSPNDTDDVPVERISRALNGCKVQDPQAGMFPRESTECSSHSLVAHRLFL